MVIKLEYMCSAVNAIQYNKPVLILNMNDDLNFWGHICDSSLIQNADIFFT